MKLIAAISGGVDSCVLLHMLKAEDHELVVSHFDHRMRDDSDTDSRFVERLAETYDLDFELGESSQKLTSEAEAREARWDFLRKVSNKHGADKIATGHHQDDALETSVINLMRGTGRHGFVSLHETSEILRPLLNMSKQEIHDYALKHSLEWVEDSSNRGDGYTRNKIRHHVLPKFNYFDRDLMLRLRASVASTNRYLDALLQEYTHEHFAVDERSAKSSRLKFTMLPYKIRKELIHHLWRSLLYEDIDSRDIERLVVAIATAKSGAIIDGSKKLKLDVQRTEFTLYLSS